MLNPFASPTFSTALKTIISRRSYKHICKASKDSSPRNILNAASKSLGVSELAISQALASELDLPFHEALPPIAIHHLFGFNFSDFKRFDLFPLITEGKVTAIAGLDPQARTRMNKANQRLPFVMTSASALDDALLRLSDVAEKNLHLPEDLIQPLLLLLTTSHAMNSSQVLVERNNSEQWQYSFSSNEKCVGVGTLEDSFGEKLKHFLVGHALTGLPFKSSGYSVEVKWRDQNKFHLSIGFDSNDRSKVNVLLVDENPAFLTTTAHYLQKSGFKVLTVIDEDGALGILNHNPEIRIIIIDPDKNPDFLNFSDADSCTGYVQLPLRTLQSIGVIMWSSDSAPKPHPSFGCTRVLGKPTDPRVLISEILFLSKLLPQSASNL